MIVGSFIASVFYLLESYSNKVCLLNDLAYDCNFLYEFTNIGNSSHSNRCSITVCSSSIPSRYYWEHSHHYRNNRPGYLDCVNGYCGYQAYLILVTGEIAVNVGLQISLVTTTSDITFLSSHKHGFALYIGNDSIHLILYSVYSWYILTIE